MIIKFTAKFGKYDSTKVGVSEEVPDGIALEIIRKGYAIPDGEEEKPKDVVIKVIDARTVTTASVKTNKKPVKKKKK